MYLTIHGQGSFKADIEHDIFATLDSRKTIQKQSASEKLGVEVSIRLQQMD